MSRFSPLPAWLKTLGRDILTVPAEAKYPSAWYAGLPVDPGDFTSQLVHLRISVALANVDQAKGLVEQPQSTVSP